MDIKALTDAQLEELAARIVREQDDRLPLDPVPWTWQGYPWSERKPPRYAAGPYNEGNPYPHGQLSELLPRKGYRQNLEDYSHTYVMGAYLTCEEPDHKHKLRREETTLLGGPFAGARAHLKYCPRAIVIRDYRYERVDDPETGAYLGAYAWVDKEQGKR